jgi:hypothetical protein
MKNRSMTSNCGCQCVCCREVGEIIADVTALLERIARLDSVPTIDPRLERLAELERELAAEEPGVRAATIRARMGLSRSVYYRLRLSCFESHESQVESGTGD